MAPEVVDGDVHDGRLADCYALGATIFCVRCGRPPFIGIGQSKNKKLMNLYCKIKNEPLSFPIPGIDSGLMDLISKLMIKNPMHRMPLREAMQHHWLRSRPGGLASTNPSEYFKSTQTVEVSFEDVLRSVNTLTNTNRQS